jgi:hypothetical protein
MYSDMREIFYDAWRFISMFYDTIRRSALHTYHSALPFIPARNLFYKIYKKDMCDVQLLNGGPERWDALVATRNHESEDPVRHVTFSLGGSHLASWTREWRERGDARRRREEVKLWDATSGT